MRSTRVGVARSGFAGFRFPPEVITVAVRWYLRLCATRRWLCPDGGERPSSVHDLRHPFVTLSLDSGASLRDVQDAAGHADPRTTRRYDRARNSLDRHPTYNLSGLIA